MPCGSIPGPTASPTLGVRVEQPARPVGRRHRARDEVRDRGRLVLDDRFLLRRERRRRLGVVAAVNMHGKAPFGDPGQDLDLGLERHLPPPRTRSGSPRRSRRRSDSARAGAARGPRRPAPRLRRARPVAAARCAVHPSRPGCPAGRASGTRAGRPRRRASATSPSRRSPPARARVRAPRHAPAPARTRASERPSGPTATG